MEHITLLNVLIYLGIGCLAAGFLLSADTARSDNLLIATIFFFICLLFWPILLLFFLGLILGNLFFG